MNNSYNKAAREVIAQAKIIKLSERDSLHVLNALENPPTPNPKLLAVATHTPYMPFGSK